MKFKFPYDKLLDHRKMLEEMARKEFMFAQIAVDEAESVLKGLYDDVDNARLRTSEVTRAGGAQAAVLTQINDFIIGQKYRIEKQRETVRGLLIKVEEKQAALLEAVKEHKTLIKLKERRYEEFKKLRKKQDLKQVDEMVTTRFKREGA